MKLERIYLIRSVLLFVLSLTALWSCNWEEDYFYIKEIGEVSKPLFYVDSTSFKNDEEGPNGTDYWINNGEIWVVGNLDTTALIEVGIYDPKNPVMINDFKDSLGYKSFTFRNAKMFEKIEYLPIKFYEKAMWVKYTPNGVRKGNLVLKTCIN